jgi:hypothetical protein
MSKVMYVTVGTSLFHSASWEAEAIRHDVGYYHEWTDEETLKSPEDRKRAIHGRKIQESLESALTATNAGQWADRLASDLLSGKPDTTTVMRYSAELATILKLFEDKGGATATLGDFLRSYDHIYLPCDSSGKGTASLPYAAAHHLAAYLNRLAGNDGLLAQPLPVPGLSSDRRDVLLGETTGLGQLSKLIENEKATQQDFVISGGYKLYGVYLYPLLEAEDRSVRLLYIHEDGNQLLVISRPAKEEDRRSIRRRMIGVFNAR